MLFRRLSLILSAALLTGCAGGRVSLIPNSDPNLRKTSTQFAADAASRHPYPADAPKAGTAAARAEVAYMAREIHIINLSDQDWKDVDVWVNQKYVVHIPDMQPHALKTLPFQMIYDEKGNYFPLNKTLVDNITIYRDGKLYDVTTKIAD
jgi:hypothetical protein